MDTTQVALALEAWAAEVVPELNHYEHAPTVLTEALPLVVAEVQGDGVQQGKQPGMTGGGYQQTYMRVWTASLLLMVPPGQTPEETWTASRKLYSYVDALGAALLRDHTLGSRVEVASPLYTASYDPPEMEYADGTVIRAATFRVNVGEQTGGV
jgi:hypothetical protein